MKLCLRPIEADLPSANEPAVPNEVPPDDANPWRDSSLDLERGLDVIELPLDIPTVGDRKGGDPRR
jgi:hypothetical protein